MNIGLTQRILHYNDIAYDCIEHGWYNLLYDHTLNFIPNNNKLDIDKLTDNLDFVIFTGGDSNPKRHVVECKLLTQCYLKNIPILGVCHGAFFLNYMEDGINQNIENHRNTEHTVLLEDTEYVVNSYHDIGLTMLANCMIPYGWASDGSIEAFRHKDRVLWGISWHPERMKNPVLPNEIKRLLNI